MFNLFSRFFNPLKGQNSSMMNPMDWIQQMNGNPTSGEKQPSQMDFLNMMPSNNGMDFTSLNQYIQETIHQALANESVQPSTSTPSSDGSLLYQVFELHDYIIVQLSIPAHIDENQLHIRLGNCKLSITGLPNNEIQIIPLPTQPLEKGISAKCKNKMLEIRLPKKQIEPSIDITW